MFTTLLSSGIHYGLLAMLGWGFSDYLAALVSKKEGSYRSFFWVMFFSLISMLAFFLLEGTLFSLNLPLILFSFAAGCLHAVGGLAFYKGLEVGQVSLVSPIASAWSIVTIFGGILFFQESFSSEYLLPLTLIIVGTVLVATDIKMVLRSWKSIFSDKGIPYAFVAMFGWGTGFMFLNQAIKVNGWLLPNIILFLVVSVLVFFYLLIKRVSLKPTDGKHFWKEAVIAGLLWAAAYIGYSVGIENYSASVIAPLGAAFPVITIVLATVLLKEKLNVGQVGGIIGILSGVVLLSV